MKRFILPVLFFILVISSKSRAADIIKNGELLNLDRCIEIALTKHPNMIASANTVNVNQSRVGQAEANYYPQVTLTSGYKKLSGPPGDSFDQYSTGVSLNQNIYDFGKTPTQVKIQDLNLESSRSDLENVSEQIIFNVRQAYYKVLQARRNRDVSADTVKQFQLHLEQAKGFYEVGTRPKFDVTKAEVDLSNAKLNLIKAENALRISIVNLNNAIGIPDAQEYSVEDNLSFEGYNITFEDAIKRAYENRPDLKSIITKKDVAAGSIDLAKKGYYPALTGNASYNWSGEKFPLEDEWNIGASLSIPIFSGYLTTYQVEESRANLNALNADEELLRQNIFLDVQQAYLNLREAEERIPTAELTVKQAEENFGIAKGRYEAGVGNPVELTDAEVALVNAKTAYIQALYDYRTAQAILEKAMGTR